MSNPYCSITQLGAFCDIRQVGELSNDTNADAANNTNLQLLLDAQAGELESALAGRYPLPLPTVPAVLTKWVAVTTVAALYRRRSDVPDGVKEDAAWAKDWIERLIARQVTLVGTAPQQPALVSSESMDGTSRFDGIPYFADAPTKTSTSKGKLWNPNGGV